MSEVAATTETGARAELPDGIKPTIVLASASPRRRELMHSLRLPFIVCALDTDESVEPGISPERVVEQLALRKATAVRDERLASGSGRADEVIVGADTVVVLDAGILGKPRDKAEAKTMLTALQGREHAVFTGVAVVHADGRVQVSHRLTVVRMKPLSARQIDRYIATGEPDDKAGAYAIQGLGALFVDSIDGCYYNVVGLPLALLADLLRQFDIDVWM